VAYGATSTRAAKNATEAIPVVMIVHPDPVGAGLVSSLAHPGGNITGLARLSQELSAKRLALLKEAVPGLTRVAALWYSESADGERSLQRTEDGEDPGAYDPAVGATAGGRDHSVSESLCQNYRPPSGTNGYNG